MGILKNTTIRQAEVGFYLNDKFNGLPHSVGTVNVSTITLFSTTRPLTPMTIELDTLVIQDINGLDITPADNEDKAEAVAVILAQSVEASITSDPVSPLSVNNNEITVDDVDWENSDFTGWIGEPKDLFGNVNNGGIYNDLEISPKMFILKLKRTKKMRDFGIGTSIGTFSNINIMLLGSGNAERGVLDLSEDSSKETSLVFSESEFVFNAIKIEFSTLDRIDVTNLFFKYTSSHRKQDYIHKFGLNPDIDSGGDETVWTLGDQYIFTETPQIYYISSSNAADTVEIVVETVGINADGKYQQEIIEITLQGQTKVAIPTDFLCVASNRAFNSGATPLVGDVYIYEDTTTTGGVPTDLSKVRSIVQATKEQTEQAVYTVPEFLADGRKVLFAELYKWNGSAIRGRETVGIFNLYVVKKLGVPRIQSTRGLSSYYVSSQDFGENTPLIIDNCSDIYLQASEIDQNNVTVEADFIIKLVTG